MQITPSGQACGASVSGVDLRQPLSADLVGTIRAAWLQHHVLAFPDQDLSDDDLERFTLAFGGFGDDPFIAPIKGRKHVIAVERLADWNVEHIAAALRGGGRLLWQRSLNILAWMLESCGLPGLF
jgi:alpha-ketoglutarate-dependent taurine dioxygenase